MFQLFNFQMPQLLNFRFGISPHSFRFGVENAVIGNVYRGYRVWAGPFWFSFDVRVVT